RPRLEELRMPVLVLAGRFDRIVCPSLTVQFQKYAPQARFVMFEKSGHLPFAEEPDETFAALDDFLDRPRSR
ncbi:MAG TPA: alpha/beta fold hydrolase, partial [Myxococcaceae bacterium]|nr:alpha/beta fold hydrolase [Myxococcaceae bacterium]